MRLNKKIYLIPLFLSLTSCSVYMAANKKGTPVEELNVCKTRSCILAKGGVPSYVKRNSRGDVIEERYWIRKPTGSAVRAVMHGALDFATLGIWELAGTPIECTMDRTKFYSVKVNYRDNEIIKSVELG